MVPVEAGIPRVAVHAVDVVVSAGKQGGAAGSAQAVGDEGIGEAQALFGNAIDVGRFDQAAAIATERSLGHTFTSDPQDVGTLGQGARRTLCAPAGWARFLARDLRRWRPKRLQKQRSFRQYFSARRAARCHA